MVSACQKSLITSSHDTMGEVGDKHPRRREPNAGEEGHREHESPTLADYLTECSNLSPKVVDSTTKCHSRRAVECMPWGTMASAKAGLNREPSPGQHAAVEAAGRRHGVLPGKTQGLGEKENLINPNLNLNGGCLSK